MSDFWNDERVETLTKMWMAGQSASRIAAEIGHGLTRSAVCGKAHRLGLKREKTVIPGHVDAEARKQTIKKAAEKKAAQPVVPPPPPPPVAPPAPTPGRPLRMNGEAVTIEQLTQDHCRWPFGDPADWEGFRYCGRPRLGPGPYCPGHQAQAFVKPPPRIRKPTP